MDAHSSVKMHTIAVGTQKLNGKLFLMEHPPGEPVKPPHGNGVEQTVRRVIQLEFEVTVLMVRYMVVGCRQPAGRTSTILEELWEAFLNLDKMYLALAMLADQLEGRGHLCPHERKRLKFFWVRLNRLTAQLKEYRGEKGLLVAGRDRVTVH